MSKVSYENSMWVLLDDDGNRHSFESKHELEQYLDLCDQYLTLYFKPYMREKYNG